MTTTSDILNLPVRDFLAATAAKQPTPGGGSVTALAGALASSLAAMALRYTIGKKAYAAYEPELTAALTQFDTASKMLQELITEDIAAYDALSQMLKLPEPDRLAHPDYTATVVAAIRAPQTTGAIAENILHLASTLTGKTNKFLLSDLGIAAVFAHATVHASELNVRINLPLLPNKEEAAALKQSLHDQSLKADKTYEEIRSFMLKTL
ncbi:MAG TPA: cyclodeaminase/cyclohydrolase family protein [Phycisphaerae bacterium]|nr:cyclodeaminase/cyclohydrolase family protein [Phycisphaerae bacterium]